MRYAEISAPVEAICRKFSLVPSNVRRIQIDVDRIQIEHYRLNSDGNKHVAEDGRVAMETLVIPLTVGGETGLWE